MNSYRCFIEFTIKAQNLESAMKKMANIEKRVKGQDVHMPHTHMEGVRSS